MAPTATTPATTATTWWRGLEPFLRPYRLRLVLALLLSISAQGLIALLPWVQKIIVDDAIVSQRRRLLPWLGLLLLLAGVAFVLNFFRRSWSARVSLDVQDELRRAIHRRMNRLDPTRLAELSIGDVMSRAAGDCTLIQAFFNQLPILAANATMLVVATVVMIALSPLLSIVFVVFIPLFLVLAVRFRDRIFPATWNDQRLAASVAGVVDEAVSGVRVVKAFAQEDRELALLVSRSRALFASRMRTARLTAQYSSTLAALPSLAQFGVLIAGGWLAIEGRLTLGSFLAFSTYLVQLVTPVRMLSGMLATSQQARAGAERVLELLAIEPCVRERHDAAVLKRGPGALALEHITFTHRGAAEPVLKDISLVIRPGERIAVVGASGSGKTTLALLLARFYDPTSGIVRIDGTDVRVFSLQSLRRQVGVVFEDSYLFSGTIRDNIALASPNASDAAVERAARAAQAHAFIAALPAGYEARVGEHGHSLSGGQRQRIALARTLLANPSVLVFDDATSAIDARTEGAIHREFEQILGERTTVLIAHRHSTLRLATRVVVLDRGRIVAEGTNAELLERCPLYRDLLAGPELDGFEPSPVEMPARVDPRAWPVDDPGSAVDRAASIDTAIGLVSAAVVGTAGGGGPRDLGGHRAALVAATPELLAKVAALPPAHDEPDVSSGQANARPSGFSLPELIRPLRHAIAAGAALVCVDAATTLAGPLLVQRAIDAGIVARSRTTLFGLAACFLALQIVNWANSRAMQISTGRTSENLLFSLRVRTFAHLQRLSLDFFDRETSGRIMTRMTTDVEAFALLMQQGLLTALVSLLTCGGVVVVLLALKARLAAAFIVTLPIILVATVGFFRASAKAYIRARERVSAVHSDMQETITGVRVTQACVNEGRSDEQFTALSRSYRDARLRSMELIALYFPSLHFMSVVTKALVLAAGASMIARGEMTLGVLLAFLLYLDQFFMPLQQLSVVFDQWIQARVSLTRLRELLGTRTRTPELAAPVTLETLTGDIRFAGVRFAYDGGDEALRGVDLHVRAGEVVALVGTTGAGKSTFVKLVARFYDATAGEVCIDGVPIAHLALAPYRRRIGYVPQEAFLFSGTVRSNIAYGRSDATDLEVERAARLVDAHAFISSLPAGYQTPVAERGRSLSAGQRQLICLARAALVNPALLILDEATSNLDLATESRVRRAMRSLARGRTTLLIAHRLQTARTADRIVVLDEGRIVEQGAHDELVARRGPYAKLWEAFAQAARPHAQDRRHPPIESPKAQAAQ